MVVYIGQNAYLLLWLRAMGQSLGIFMLKFNVNVCKDLYLRNVWMELTDTWGTIWFKAGHHENKPIQIYRKFLLQNF